MSVTPPIDGLTAIHLAQERIARDWDLANLTPIAQRVGARWVVQFQRHGSPGGEPRVVLDAVSGVVIEVVSSQ